MARALRLVAAVTVLALGACGSPGAGTTTVRMQIFGDTAEIKAYRALIEAYERTAPGHRVELVAVPKQGDHYTKLATSFVGGTPPDVFLANFRRFGQFAAKGVLEPLGPLVDPAIVAGMYPQAVEAFRFDGVQVCLPQNISSLVVYWNTRLFAEAGVDPPRAGWTWNEFLAAAKALTKDVDGDGTTDVYGVGTEPTLIRLAPFVWQAGGEVVDDTEDPTQTTLLDERALRANRFFIELRRVHKVAPSMAEAESEDLETRFQAGRLGMILESRRFTATLREVPGVEWDVAPLPRDREEATVLHSDAYCMPKTTKVRDAVLRFVSFALGAEGQRIIAPSGRTVPSLREVAESEIFLDPTLPPRSARVFLDSIPLIRRVPNIATWHEIETKANVIVEEWYYGIEPPQQLGIEIDLATRDLFAER